MKVEKSVNGSGFCVQGKRANGVIRGIAIYVLLAVVISFFGINGAYAAERTVIVGTVTDNKKVSVYVKGFAESDSFTALVGSKEVKISEKSTVAKDPIPMKTLLLVDNSVGADQNTKKMFSSFMENYVADKGSHEMISIGVFGEKYSICVDYTDDYVTLINAVKGISYAERKTYLTDVLYEIAEKNKENTETSYRRVVLLTDGVEDESIGYTRDELYGLLEENRFPVYVLGSKTKNNSSQLESAFAVSRKSGAKSYILNEVDDMLDVAEELKDDEKIVRLSFVLDDDMLDGSEKTVKISNGSSSATAEIRMPQKAVSESSSALAQEPLNISIDEDMTTGSAKKDDAKTTKGDGSPRSIFDEITEITEEKKDESFADKLINFFKNYWLYFAIGGGVLIILIIVLIIVHSSRKKKKMSEPEQVNQFEQPADPYYQMPADLGSDETVKINYAPDVDSDATVRLWENKTAYVFLQDVNRPEMSFRQIVNGTMTIGRSASKNMIVINYDKSISGRHCEITLKEGVFYIKDSGSSNGTFVNNERITGETALNNGDYINLGQTTLVFEGSLS